MRQNSSSFHGFADGLLSVLCCVIRTRAPQDDRMAELQTLVAMQQETITFLQNQPTPLPHANRSTDHKRCASATHTQPHRDLPRCRRRVQPSRRGDSRACWQYTAHAERCSPSRLAARVSRVRNQPGGLRMMGCTPRRRSPRFESFGYDLRHRHAGPTCRLAIRINVQFFV